MVMAIRLRCLFGLTFEFSKARLERFFVKELLHRLRASTFWVDMLEGVALGVEEVCRLHLRHTAHGPHGFLGIANGRRAFGFKLTRERQCLRMKIA